MRKGKIRLILEEHWSEFSKRYGKNIRKNVKREVEKVLRCRDTKYGYIELICDKCNTTKKVGFTCKSRFCTSCGKVYVDNWINSMLKTLINVRHRHIVFTIPEELRIFFGQDRERLKILPKCSAEAVMSWMKEINRKEEFTPGIVAVIHTFGRDLKWNPHVHMMITEGGKGNITMWKHIRFLPYEMLRKRWQKCLLDEIEKVYKDKKAFKRLKNKLYKNNYDGFYVHAKTEIKSAKIAAKYIGRYVGRPAIAESRILKYDGKFVTYKYTRHEDNKIIVDKVPVYQFIKKIIMHIPEKNFKMIRYFGLYARRSKDKENFIKMIDEKIVALQKSINNWEFRILAAFGVDPCQCPNCGNRMRFNDIVYKKYGSMKAYFRRKFIDESEEKFNEVMELYTITKGILCGRIRPTT